MSKKNKKTLEKKLYIDVDYYESTGSSEDPGDGSPYSGYSHSIIHINSYGPLYFSEEGRGYLSREVESSWYHYEHNWRENKDLPKICSHPNEEECQDIEFLYIVVVRFGDGGTFGRTDGYFEFPFISKDEQECIDWIHTNSSRIKQAHSGYFESFEGVGVEKVSFVKNPEDVPARRWWGPNDLPN